MMEHKTDMKIIEIQKYKSWLCRNAKQIQGPQNKIQLHIGEPKNKHIQIEQRSNKPQNSPGGKLKKIFKQKLTSMQFLYL